MKQPHDAAKQNAIDMSAARQRSKVKVRQLTHYLHRGEERWNRRQEILKLLSKDPVFDKTQKLFLDRTQLYSRAMRITNRMLALEQEHGWTPEEFSTAFSVVDENSSIGLHMLAFQPVFMAQAGKELLSKYGPLVKSRAILGCYLQTELAHGTNVGALETTATYIPETKEFEINSPTLTSSKWWIGALGKTATHGVVQAKLILPDGKDMGPHLFFVQLRSLEDHRPLPGITAGDIGPKVGTNAVDNGFGTFDHVRIPKEHMLSKFAQVTDDGKYVRPPHAKISYGGMLYIRVSMVAGAGWTCAKAATIAIRYATVRRQGEIGEDGLERRVITYPSLHYRLLPVLAHAYVYINLSEVIVNAFAAMSDRLSSGDASLLPEMHAITSGLKVLATTNVIANCETARRSMGGHGYSAFAGVGRIYTDYVPAATFEGENFVLDQQVVRAALKSYRNHIHSKSSSLSPSSYYLRLLQNSSEKPPSISSSSWADYKTLILLLEWRAAYLVQEAAQTASSPDASIGQRVSKAVTEAFVAARVGDMIQNVSENLDFGDEEKNAVNGLYRLYLLTTLEAALADLLSYQLLRSGSSLSENPIRNLRMAIADLCQELLPNAIGLTDAFGFSDWELDSALGRYDGRAYEALVECAKNEPLNHREISEAYEESIRPILTRGKMAAAKL